ncbi:hypothetical protein LTR36_008023 [Oleoguttula mirabilis]|uniref:NAD(P)-binding domain-containing protein n=1 Tax=Oleoguttula mirabilis TaxID=1507867 RepID=A0AAV9J9M2_9PEZI|nr:hypothetical protein LTR36_008023 [Oleoguttula mirabilis]
MKVVLFGATGYIGGEVLQRCLARPDITAVVTISRRDPGVAAHAKLTVVLHDNFTHYPDNILAHFADAGACIYCLGTNMPVAPPELNRKINFEYALNTARTFASIARRRKEEEKKGLDGSDTGAPAPASPIRFVYNSGAAVEKDASKTLWFLAQTRKMRGEVENALLALQEEQAAAKNVGFEVVIARPGGVMPQGAVIRTWLGSKLVMPAIMRGDLGEAMVELALKGSETVLVENAQLVAIGRAAGSDVKSS